MKKLYTALGIMIVIGIIVALSGLASAEICDDDNNLLTTSIPCEAITPANILCSDNVSIVYLTNTSMNYSINMSLKIPASNTYNFTFNYTDIGQYSVTLCDNTTLTATLTTPTPSIPGGSGGYGSGVIYSPTNLTEPATQPEIVRICNLKSSDGVKNCIMNFIDSSYKNWIIFIMIICTIIIITEYYHIGITRLVLGKNAKPKEQEQIV